MDHQQRGAAGLHVEVPAHPDSVALARDAVRSCSSIPADVSDDLVIVVSELVTNAVRHAGLTGEDKVMLDVILLEDAVRVEVTDSGPGFDRARAAVHKPMGEGGFGLHIVSMLSRAWGVVPGRGAVWADVGVPDIIH